MRLISCCWTSFTAMAATCPAVRWGGTRAGCRLLQRLPFYCHQQALAQQHCAARTGLPHACMQARRSCLGCCCWRGSMQWRLPCRHACSACWSRYRAQQGLRYGLGCAAGNHPGFCCCQQCPVLTGALSVRPPAGRQPARPPLLQAAGSAGHWNVGACRHPAGGRPPAVRLLRPRGSPACGRRHPGGRCQRAGLAAAVLRAAAGHAERCGAAAPVLQAAVLAAAGTCTAASAALCCSPCMPLGALHHSCGLPHNRIPLPSVLCRTASLLTRT